MFSKKPVLFGFGLVALTWSIAFTAWVQTTPDALTSPSAYDLFPLLGLMAFSALWSTYVVSAVAAHQKTASEKLKPYYQIAGYTILILILSHPTMLVVRLALDGFGLPPASYAEYVSENMLWVVYLGVTSLFIFLAYELHRWFERKNWWKWVLYANDAAMFLILYHGMTLGGELQGGWFRYVWWFYGFTLVGAVIYLRFVVKRNPRPVVNEE